VRLRACFFPNSNQNSAHNLRLKQTIMATLVGSGFRAAQVLTASRGFGAKRITKPVHGCITDIAFCETEEQMKRLG
jgi:hypothetical protein